MEIKQSIRDVLKSFTGEGDLFVATTALLAELGIRLNTSTREPINGGFATIYSAVRSGEKMPKDAEAILSRVAEVCLIGSVSDDTLAGGASSLDAVKDAHYNGMLVFAAEIAPRKKTLTRTELAAITRIANRCAKDNPVTVVFREGEYISIATCERTAYKQVWRPGERLGKVSILKGVNCLSPHRGHIDILESMNVKKAKNFDELYAQWQKVFSSSLLTNKFYNDLFNWYVWAIESKSRIHFPLAIGSNGVACESIETKVIRLLSRLMFVWFVKQKGLIPESFFDVEYLKTILKEFNPQSESTGEYYNAILQNLFFATLNRAIIDEDGKRRFATAVNQVDSKNLYRYEELFSIPQESVIDIFAQIPYVNASLFECLDKTKCNDGEVKAYNDGFSRNDTRDGSGIYRHRAVVPNKLFFDKNRGLFALFSRYSFTIEENTPFDQQVALDPELLGKVFENLLGAYNEETSESARKQSGSFYTPRQMVEYKVNQALMRYLGTTDFIKQLLSDEFQYNELDKDKYEQVAQRLRKIKVLDPACGSGAFPMGILNRILDLFDLMHIEEDRYTLKRHIIEHCLFGVDKQCIATLITRLRFFISLIIDCTYDSSKENFGIPVLPNLENNFVTADTLVGIKQSLSSISNDEIAQAKEDLHNVLHDHFNAKSASLKRRLVEQDKVLRKRLAELLVGKLYSAEDAQRLSTWNPYCQNVSADFFDAEWMLGVSDGFDVVIGNPPHGAKIAPAVAFEPYTLKCGETAILFIEKGLSFVKPGGLLLYVLPKPFCYASNYQKTRNYVVDTLQQIVDCGKMFDKVKFEECVVILQPSKPVDVYESLVFNKSLGFTDFGLVEKKVKDEFGLFLNGTSVVEISLGRRLRRNCKQLGDYVTNTRGGQVQKFVKNIADFPVIGGKGISRYGIVSEKGAVSKNDIQADNWYCKEDSILAQNLVAHIANPVPHIKIAACFSPGGRYVIADTVNQISIIDPQMPKQLLWAILNSRLINWYSYKFIFGNAIRTMHFDAVSTDKIPIPDLTDGRIAEIVKQADATLAAHVQHQPTTECDRELDEAICRLYGLNDEETATIMAMPT